MPPATRSQTLRRTIATNSVPVQEASHATRPREWKTEYITNDDSFVPPKQSVPDEIPRFVIDLSLPPEQRYVEVVAAYKKELVKLVSLFDDVFSGVTSTLPFASLSWIHFACSWIMRRVYDEEENKELRGISSTTGVSMYLLVCFNVLLDVFMGCSSGGARVSAEDDRTASKMVHFRTLDWGMPALRKIIVQLDFKLGANDPIIASSITYAGYVGVLTGVRKDFSVSLNFRPQRNYKGNFWSDLLFYWHLLMVVCGRRPSISSELRKLLLPGTSSLATTVSSSSCYENAIYKFTRGQLTTTVCYLCFCNGSETTIVEKDRVTAVTRSSREMTVITNHDVDDSSDRPEQSQETDTVPDSQFLGALTDILHEARDRKECAEHNYQALLHARKRARKSTFPDLNDIIELVQKYPTTNEATHYACVLDPKQGSIVWSRKWTRPVGAKWIREHMS